MAASTSSAQIALARLPRSAPHEFSLRPDPEAATEIARGLGIEGARKLRLEGTLTPEGARDWRLDAELGATVVQSCVVTLAPVTTRIDQPLTRLYRAELPEPVEDEVEMPEDDRLEPLPATLDLMALLSEAIALAMPDYPRAEGADLGAAVFAAPGVIPMTDEDAKPLAGLAALRDKLKGDGEDGTS